MAKRSIATSVHVIVDTPRGSRNKFKFDPQLQRFRLAKVLPAGMSFPYDFGYVPETAAEDGDPLDVLLLMDAPAFAGCLVECRLVGVLEAEQAEGDEVIRNDRLIGVATAARDYGHIRDLKDLNSNLVDEIEQFFSNYNAAEGKRFTILSRKGPAAARTLLRRASVS
jgi:inorganic pyrophosphatase